MHKIVLIKKYSPSNFFWGNLKKKKKIDELSLEQILDNYQGFEGEAIAFFSVKIETEVENIIKKNLELQKQNNYLLLHLFETEKKTIELPNQAFFVGYDVGICEEEKTIYSSIFNEILFGNLHELIVHKNYLNKYLLFQDKSHADVFVQLHEKLSVQGKDVEDYEKIKIYEIWKQI